MRFETVFAIRFLRSIKQLNWARLTAAAAVIGIAAGVTATVFANALANGFRQEMQTKILQNTAHVRIAKIDAAEIFDWQNLSERIERIENVKTVSAVAYENALVVGKTDSAFAVVKAVQSSKSQVQNLEAKNGGQKLRIQIGRGLAQKIGSAAGDAATIVARGESSFNNAELNQSFAPTSTVVEVGGIFSTGLYEYDQTWVLISLDDWARISGKNSASASALEVETADIYSSNLAAAEIQKVLGADYKVLDWQETNRPLFAALSLERRITVVIVAIVIFIAALNIVTTLALIVNERRADIAILKTCGARKSNVVLIFLMQGAILGAVGAVSGILLGLIVCRICNRFNLINLPPDVYSINQVVLQPEPFEILLTGAAAFILSLIASWFPALAAARVKPFENLRK